MIERNVVGEACRCFHMLAIPKLAPLSVTQATCILSNPERREDVVVDSERKFKRAQKPIAN